MVELLQRLWPTSRSLLGSSHHAVVWALNKLLLSLQALCASGLLVPVSHRIPIVFLPEDFYRGFWRDLLRSYSWQACEKGWNNLGSGMNSYISGLLKVRIFTWDQPSLVRWWQKCWRTLSISGSSCIQYALLVLGALFFCCCCSEFTLGVFSNSAFLFCSGF